MFFGSKNNLNPYLEQFRSHMESIKQTYKYMNETIEVYFTKDIDKAKELAFMTHSEESNADSKRRNTIESIYKSSHMSSYKEELISYIAKQDKIADRAESTVDFLVTQQPNIPSDFYDDIKDLIKIIATGLEPLSNAVDYIFTDYSKFKNEIFKIRQIESEVDTIEWHMAKQIFSYQKFNIAEKMHFQEFIYHLAHISDIIEEAAEKLESVVVKKKI